MESLQCFDKQICKRLCCCLIHLMWMWLIRTFMTSSRKQPKRPFHAVIKTIIFRVGMLSVNPSIQCSCSLLRETTQFLLLQLYLPNLTGSRGIDNPLVTARKAGSAIWKTVFCTDQSWLTSFFNIYTYDLPFTISRKFAYADNLALLQSYGN